MENTTIDSGCDINIFADSNSNKNESYLTMSLLSDAYNRTAIQLSTNPALINNMTQKNSVNIDSGSNLKSMRNINLQSTTGDSEVFESTREYNIYTGTNVEIDNPFMDEYNKTKSAMEDYDSSSQQYQDLQAQLTGIEDSMVTYGFAERTSSGCNIHETLTQNVVDIPNFALSGGDIKISAGSLGGKGSFTARTATFHTTEKY